MSTFCLVPAAVEKFKQSLKDGTIDPQKLSEMTSAERNIFFSGIVGETNAKEVNALFESKLLLKNQKAGYISWAKKVSGISKETRRDLVSRIERLQNVLDPQAEQQFLSDLASTRLGFGVTEEEAKNISDLSKKVDAAKTAMDAGGDRMDWGRAKIELLNYATGLKLESEKTGVMGAIKDPLKTVSNIAGMAKSMKASFDNSAIFRQGWKTLWTHPLQWQKNALQSFVSMAKEFGGQAVMDEVNADIISRPTYDKMKRAKLGIGTVEEAFPSSLPEKLPLIGRAFKASESAFTSFVYRQRADIFDKYLEIAEKSGVNINDDFELKSIGKLVNSLTGRGDLGGLEPAASTINNVFFSPRFLKSHIDTLTVHATDKMSSFARKQAAINLLKIIMGTAAVIGLARTLKKDSVELDPRSSDFGKIKIKNTRFDVSGGMASIITLAARLLTMSSKSSTTGMVTKLNSGSFGGQTGLDIIYNFFENKLSPAAAIVKDLLTGKDFNGNKPTVLGELNNLMTPLPITNFLELQKDPNAAPVLVAMMADALGIGTNTYGKAETDWNKSTGKQINEFRKKVGEEKFKQANEQFNKEYAQWFNTLITKPSYQNLSDESKQKVLVSGKEDIQTAILKKYGYVYKQKKPTSQEKSEKTSIKNLLPK